MNKVLLIVILLFKFLIYQHSFADDTFTCPAVSDVYIDELVPDENLNYKTRILISYHPSKGTARGLFKFDIPMDLEASQIETATLYLSGSYHTGGGDAIDIYCYALNASFDEEGDTWHTLSGGDYDTSVISPGALPAGNDWETSIDVTALVTGNLDKVREYGMLMRLQSEGPLKDYQNVASREVTDPQDFPAYIEIAYSDPTSSTTTITPTTTSIYNPPPPPKTTTTTIIKVTSSSTSPTTTSTSIKPTTTTTILVPIPTSTSSIVSTTTTTISICPIEQIYGENSVEVQKIRFIRDNILNTTIEGQTLIRLYYEWSPFLVECIENNGELKIELKEIIDELLQVIQ